MLDEDFITCISEVKTVWHYINLIIIFYTLGRYILEGFGKIKLEKKTN